MFIPVGLECNHMRWSPRGLRWSPEGSEMVWEGSEMVSGGSGGLDLPFKGSSLPAKEVFKGRKPLKCTLCIWGLSTKE